MIDWCSDAERVNYATVADIKDPLITKVIYQSSISKYKGYEVEILDG